MSDPTVSNLILRQLGGNAFLAMTGARDLTYDDRSLTMRLPKARGVRYVRIQLNDRDLYDLTGLNGDGDARSVRHDVPVENLRRAFEDATGLRTSL